MGMREENQWFSRFLAYNRRFLQTAVTVEIREHKSVSDFPASPVGGAIGNRPHLAAAQPQSLAKDNRVASYETKCPPAKLHH
jgi:hypothetical protein